MKLVKVREIVKGMDLSAEVVAEISRILAGFNENDDVPKDVLDRIIALVNVEIDAGQLAADIYQNGADMINEFLDKINNEANRVADEIEQPIH